jgi:hypothetical protein
VQEGWGMMLYCCGCEKEVFARLTNGKEGYPHRQDLYALPFWKCDSCGNFVGCHHKTKDRTRPLGVIPTKAITQIRKQIHTLLDPIWQEGVMTRNAVYARMTQAVGKPYHTAQIDSIEYAEQCLAAAEQVYLGRKCTP